MRLIVLPALATLALAACNPAPSEEAAVAPETVEAPAAELAGVDLTDPLRVLGTEPFWSVELNGSQMIYTDPTPTEISVAQPAPLLQGTIAIWQAADSAGRPLKVTLTATECSDGMSDRTYPLSAIVQLGDRTLTGCAASAAAIMTAPESGPVETPAT